ncbi:LLM class flavin-dependent oxidoreductase [Nonomuraea indica]|uniref:LLM class flavin-dependent oxidoreductase n=1 Tax=Nonomuraea indica TaxID=1581193 RepID=A0ABW8A8I4_9ACTN
MNALGLGRVGIWAGEMDRLPASVVRRTAAAVEDLGYSALWFPETTGREAVAQAALLLSATRQAVIATGTASIYARDATSAAAAQTPNPWTDGWSAPWSPPAGPRTSSGGSRSISTPARTTSACTC